MRAFLAVTLPADVQACLSRLQETLAESRADVKWVEPANLHVTLKFLDEISEAQRHEVEALVARIVHDQPPFLLGLTAPGAFPSFDSPRVLWVGLGEGKETVARLADAIERDAATLGLRREERPFAAHVTLGRARSPRARQALVQRLRAGAWQPPPPWRVASLTFYQSVLGSDGPRYSVLAEFPFSREGGV